MTCNFIWKKFDFEAILIIELPYLIDFVILR